MADGTVRTELGEDGCWQIHIDRPAEGGLLTPEMTLALAAAFDSPPAGAKMVLLGGVGADFCAGRQSPMPPPGTRVTPADLRALISRPVLDFYASARGIDLPVIAAVRGRAAGVGCALAGLADILLVDETALFSIPEMSRDIPPTLVMTALSDRLPRNVLSRMVLLGSTISGVEAVSLGLAAELHVGPQLDAAVAAYRQKLSSNSISTLATVKRFLNVMREMDFSTLRDYAATANAAALTERYL